MNKIKLLILSSLAIMVVLTTINAKTKKDISPATGTTAGQYSKPGAPVDIEYKVSHVDLGGISNVEISFITRESAKREMEIKLSLDKTLNLVAGKKNYIFQVKKEENVHRINLKLSGSENGEYFINIFVNMGNKGMRAFAVPVRIGDLEQRMQKAKYYPKGTSGENISISEGIETIH